MKFMYLIGILLENIYRLIRSFVPAMVCDIVFHMANFSNIYTQIFTLVVMIGGMWNEFKITDFFI